MPGLEQEIVGVAVCFPWNTILLPKRLMERNLQMFLKRKELRTTQLDGFLWEVKKDLYL
jgi:hypothetical protein